MKSLLLALALVLSPPAEAGKKKRAKEEAAARAESLRLSNEVAMRLAAQQYDDPEVGPMLAEALALHPDPPADLHLVDAQWRLGRSSPDFQGAVAALRRAMAARGQSPLTVPNVVLMGTTLTRMRFLAAGTDSATLRAPEEAVTEALALLDELDAYATRLEADRLPVVATRVDLLIGSSRPLAERLAAVDEGLALRQDLPQLWVYRSALLEEQDGFEPALEPAERALALAPDDPGVNFHMAALYINRSVALLTRANETDDLDQAGSLMEQGQALQQQARPYLEKVHAADPTDVEALRQLMSIAVSADDLEAYQQYKDKLDALQGG